MNRVPKIRFKEFSGEWEEKFLGELVQINTGKKDTQNRIEQGLYPFFVRSQTVERINSYSFDGEAILTAGDGVGVGKVFHYVNCKFDYHQRVYKLSHFKNILGKYLFEYFSKNFIKEVTKYTAKTSVDSIRMEMLTKMLIPITSLPEQEKIADFLSSVDIKIEKLERKKDLWKEYKKGMMQKIFSQEIRFKDENGEEYPQWEEKRLGGICTFFSGGTPLTSNKSYYRGTIPFIGSGKISDINTEQFITYEALKNSSAKLVNKGDLLYAMYGATSGEVAISKLDGAINQAVLCIRSNEDIVYIYYFLKYRKNEIINTFLQGGQGNLSAQIVKKLQIKLPKIIEQEKISNLLSSIDSKIEIIEEELEKMKVFKKGLLQGMFI